MYYRINGDVSDNRIENLELRQGWHGHGVVFKRADCGSINVRSVNLKRA